MINDEIQYKLLKIIENNPRITQRELAKELGISLGKANYCLKALKEKGWIKWGNFSSNPKKSQYIHLLTPTGISEKIILTVHFLKRKQDEYDRLRQDIEALAQEVSASKVKYEIGASEVMPEIGN